MTLASYGHVKKKTILLFNKPISTITCITLFNAKIRNLSQTKLWLQIDIDDDDIDAIMMAATMSVSIFVTQ